MKIYILGSTGMLGRYVSRYLQQYHDIIEISREKDGFDASLMTEQTLLEIINKFEIHENDVIINCIGTIKPRVDELGDLVSIKVNSVFPRLIANLCEDKKINLIHPTTDCVYSGNKGSYSEDDNYDVHDVYGMSKALGEPNNCTIIRTSIIGEELNNSRSLIEWIKSQKGNTVFGYTNHYWNGMTCLQFAKICKQIIEENLYWKGIKHFYSNSVSKKELVELVGNIYDLNLTVTPKETPIKCDRTLSTKYDTIQLYNIPTLEEQINDMKNFKLN
jgi:dTDP-4-dehydrorhamnose reductase